MEADIEELNVPQVWSPSGQQLLSAAASYEYQLLAEAAMQSEIFSPPQHVDASVELKEERSKWHYEAVPNELIRTPFGHVYQVVAFLGQGTFGRVYKCKMKDVGQYRAIKILNNHPSYDKAGENEVQMIKYLRRVKEKYNLVRAYENFSLKNHHCLVFELLQQNLHEMYQKFRLTFTEIRSILKQVLRALQKLKQIHVIHTDLKPQNIMLVEKYANNQSLCVKVIDFGNAKFISDVNRNDCYIQTLWYRAPEIILGLPYCESIDMWSLGCTIAEIFLQSALYQGSSEYDVLGYICQTHGLPSDDMLVNAIPERILKFFDRYTYRLKTHEEYHCNAMVVPEKRRKFFFNSLDDIAKAHFSYNIQAVELSADEMYRRDFIDLLKKMLALDNRQRITPTKALNHNFIQITWWEGLR